jgi:hypothetical protein
MTATYTANLASLLVEESRPPIRVESIEHAISLGIPICTYANTNADTSIKKQFSQAKRVALDTELKGYEALQRGECGLVAGYKANWEQYRNMEEYNPECDLEWVGRTVQTIKSGFAIKADAGHLCTSLVRDVLNLHLTEIINNNVLQELWDKHYSKTQNKDCNADVDRSDSTESRKLRASAAFAGTTAAAQKKSGTRVSNRFLKAASKGAAGGAVAAEDGESNSLDVQQMLGTFFFHWVGIVFSVAVAIVSKYYKLHLKKNDKKSLLKEEPKSETHTTDPMGPTRSPPLRATTKTELSMWDSSEEHSDAGGSNNMINKPQSREYRELLQKHDNLAAAHQELRGYHVELQQQMSTVIGLLHSMHKNSSDPTATAVPMLDITSTFSAEL